MWNARDKTNQCIWISKPPLKHQTVANKCLSSKKHLLASALIDTNDEVHMHSSDIRTCRQHFVLRK